MLETFKRTALAGAAAGALLSLVECALLNPSSLPTGSVSLFFLAVLLAAALYSAFIIPFALALLSAAAPFSPKHTAQRAAPAAVTSALFLYLFIVVHARWFLGGTPFFSIKSIAASLALIACALPVFFAVSFLFRRVAAHFRPLPLALIAAALVLFLYRHLLPLDAFTKPAAPPDSPNFLLVSFDTTRADHLGCYGCENARTETVDSLAARGTLFRRAYTTVPATGPAHNSLMTGLHPRTLGVVRNGIPRPDSFPNLPGELRKLGYSTAAFVSGFTMKSYTSGLHKGFDLYADAFSFLDVLDRTLAAPMLDLAGLYAHLDERPAALVTSAALRWLERRHRRPFFLFVHYFDPHELYIPPPEYLKRIPSVRENENLEKFLREWMVRITNKTADRAMIEKVTALYDAEIAYADDELARLMKFVDDNSLRDNTYVIFLSDHGEGLDDHDQYSHGHRLYDEQVRIPLIVAGPGVPRGAVSGDLAMITDVFPTVLSILNRNVPPGLHGTSLKDALFDGAPLQRDTAHFETAYEYISPLRDEYEPLDLPLMTGAADKRRKFILHRSGARELYDLAADPGELLNLFSPDDPVSADLARRTRLWDTRTAVAAPATKPLSAEAAQRLRALGYIK
ncbi:MAG: sulfatase [bacterium]